MDTVKVRVPVVIGQTLKHKVVTVSKSLADQQLSLPDNKRNPRWRGVEIVLPPAIKTDSGEIPMAKENKIEEEKPKRRKRGGEE